MKKIITTIKIIILGMITLFGLTSSSTSSKPEDLDDTEDTVLTKRPS